MKYIPALLLALGIAQGANAQWARVFTSTPDRTACLAEEAVQTYGTSGESDAIVLGSGLNQSVDGYGWAITWAACYNLMKMDPAARHALLERTYSPDKGYGVSYARITIAGHDFSSDEFTYCDVKGPDDDLLRYFSLHSDDTDYVIPVLKEILAINPSLKIIAAPWTAPRWMKYGDNTPGKPWNEWTGGRLEPKYYRTYGYYFARFIKAYADAGVRVDAVSPQNEPLNWGNSSSMYMPVEDEAAFLRDGLCPALAEAGLATKIYIYDHNYNYDNNKEGNGNYVTRVYNSILRSDFPGKELIAGSCWHNYGGKVEDIKDDVIYGDWQQMELLFTEASIGEWNNATDLNASMARDMDELVIQPALHRFRGSIGWNFILDSNNEPHRGPGACYTCHGALDMMLDADGNPTGEMRPTSQYYAMAHTSAVVKPGARRLDTSGWWTDGLTYAAFQNPDNTRGILLANLSWRNIDVKVNSNGNTYQLSVPARGVVSALVDLAEKPSASLSAAAVIDRSAKADTTVFDLQGRMVASPEPGKLYVTSDGRKVYFY